MRRPLAQVKKALSVQIVVALLELLERHQKEPSEIRWVGTPDGRHSMSWGEFLQMLGEGEFTSGVDRLAWASCVAVGDSWWASAEWDAVAEYEYWRFHQVPVAPQKHPFRYSRSGFVARVPRSEKLLSEAEVVEFFAAIESGALTVVRDTTWGDGGTGVHYYVASNGWRFSIFSDGLEWCGLCDILTPDRRNVNTDYIYEHMPRIRSYTPSEEVLSRCYGLSRFLAGVC